MAPLQLFGRRGSHFTRVARIFAEEMGVQYQLVPIYNMRELDPNTYADNPALKLPALRVGDEVVFGTENICRVIVERAGNPAGIVWPEQLRQTVTRNAQELVWHCMAAQVQIVLGTLVGKLPSDNIYFEKARTGFAGALGWLDTHVDEVLDALPASRKLSLFEVTLFCLIEHLHFRQTLTLDTHAALTSFAGRFAARPSAQRTPYEVDVRPQ